MYTTWDGMIEALPSNDPTSKIIIYYNIYMPIIFSIFKNKKLN